MMVEKISNEKHNSVAFKHMRRWLVLVK